MAGSAVIVLVCLAVGSQGVHALSNRGATGAEQERSLLQTYDKQLTGSKGVTPVTRVVNLLKEMQKTLGKEQEEDEALYDKLACWCNNNKYEKNGASDAATAKIADLEANIEMLTARSKELNTKIKELEAEFASDKAALAEATALRKKQLKEFQGMELDNIAALENLKSAIVVLGRHQGAAFAQIIGSDSDVVKRAMKVGAAFMQSQHSSGYMPSYNAASGKIFGVLKQLQDEMKAALSGAQKTEAGRAALFAELRAAKTSEIEAGEKMSETKEDELAKTDMDNAEAKEDLGQQQAQLAEDTKFLANLGKMCAEGDANFAKRKEGRLSEIQAVSETIEILAGDDAKDAMDTTFSFVQVKSDNRRTAAAAVLRKVRSPELAMLATSVELDAFTKVKAMIEKMIATLKTQQADEVKKNDWCKAELQENDMTTAKTTDLKADLEAKAGELETTIKRLSEEIEKAHLDISNLQLELQRGSENRKKENLDFQRVVADQVATAEILAKALDKLATFYDEAAFAQTSKKTLLKQTPPVAQMEYKKSSGAGGVMSMIEQRSGRRHV